MTVHKKYFSFINSVSEDKTVFNIKELKELQGISLPDIRNAIEEGKISKSFEKLGQQGFNIKQISESDYNAVLSLDDQELDNDLDYNDAQIINKKSIWVVRAGGKGEQEKVALESNLITIGWNELSDLTFIKNKSDLRERYKKIEFKETDDQVAQGVAQIWSFMNEIKIGDIVILPLLSNEPRSIAISKVTGEYEYKEATMM
jgi:hypothetical protein